MRYEIDIFYYISVYKREWKNIARLIILMMILAIIISFLQPVTYRSTLIVLSPKETNPASALGTYLGLPSLAIGGSSNDIIFSMLKSRRMSQDINEYLSPKYKRKFWWSLDTYTVTGGFAVEIRGSDPEMTKEIANFSVQNLDKINSELQVTTQKPMVKVLDPALRGVPVGRNISKKVIASGLLVFLAYSLFIFFREYFSYIKERRKL
jgi:capsular polysaccharide biosynthesis protein